MGILNVTPDSFSDGGHHERPSAAIDHALRLVDEGADIIDVGGESSRPGAAAVDARTEIDRVLAVVEALAPRVRVSIDTAKAAVAHAAIDAGATLVNDITASLAPVAAERGVGWVAMHMQGEPRTMQVAPAYDDVVAEVRDHLLARAETARAAGVTEVWIDPGIGFGKSAAHNWALLAHLDDLVATGWPVAVGTSRKAFLGAITAEADGAPTPAPTDDRLEASVTTALHAVRQGAGLVRVHDVAATVGALRAAGLRAA
jgi:dihydropteroate synthase